MFGVEVNIPLFPEHVSSLSIEVRNTPAYLCVDGVRRMAEVYKMFPDDYKVTIEYLKSIDSPLTGVKYLEYFYNKI